MLRPKPQKRLVGIHQIVRRLEMFISHKMSLFISLLP